MKKFKIYYTLTRVTENAVEIEAADVEEAKRIVEECEFDHDDANEVHSIEWSIDNATENLNIFN